MKTHSVPIDSLFTGLFHEGDDLSVRQVWQQVEGVHPSNGLVPLRGDYEPGGSEGATSWKGHTEAQAATQQHGA